METFDISTAIVEKHFVYGRVLGYFHNGSKAVQRSTMKLM